MPPSEFYTQMITRNTRLHTQLKALPPSSAIAELKTFIVENSASLLRVASLAAAAYCAGKLIENRYLDEKRDPVKQYLNDQDLSWWELFRTNTFFRAKNVYVTQFPDTPGENYMAASQMLFWLLKYLGAVERNDWWNIPSLQAQLQRFLKGDEIKQVDAMKYCSLEELFHSSIVIAAFNVPPAKRIDIEMWDARPRPITLLMPMDPNQWTAGELYKYLDNYLYIIHVYDAPWPLFVDDIKDSIRLSKETALNLGNDREWILEDYWLQFNLSYMDRATFMTYPLIPNSLKDWRPSRVDNDFTPVGISDSEDGLRKKITQKPIYRGLKSTNIQTGISKLRDSDIEKPPTIDHIKKLYRNQYNSYNDNSLNNIDIESKFPPTGKEGISLNTSIQALKDSDQKFKSFMVMISLPPDNRADKKKLLIKKEKGTHLFLYPNFYASKGENKKIYEQLLSQIEWRIIDEANTFYEE